MDEDTQYSEEELEELEEDEFLSDDEPVPVQKKEVEAKVKTTIPVMTIYESAKIIAKRARDIDNGSKPKIPFEVAKHLPSEEIARLELKTKVIPYKIIRRPRKGLFEVWSITDFKYITGV